MPQRSRVTESPNDGYTESPYPFATGNTTYESRMSAENELWVTYLNTLGGNDSH